MYSLFYFKAFIAVVLYKKNVHITDKELLQKKKYGGCGEEALFLFIGRRFLQTKNTMKVTPNQKELPPPPFFWNSPNRH